MSEIEKGKQYDAVVVLGKNLGFRSNKDHIREQREHLAFFGRSNTDAGGILLRDGRTKKIILSTGVTVAGLPSEAQLMKKHLQRIWPHVRDEDIILEEISKQTKGNAIEVKKVLEENNIDPNNVGLVTMGFHMPRAQRFFRQVGLNLDALPTEEILGREFPNILSSTDYKRKFQYIGEQVLELGYRVIQSIPIIRDIAEARVESVRS
jgi:uncharacterized SAM-binding protein YcdF (DUF218 family)